MPKERIQISKAFCGTWVLSRADDDLHDLLLFFATVSMYGTKHTSRCNSDLLVRHTELEGKVNRRHTWGFGREFLVRLKSALHLLINE